MSVSETNALIEILIEEIRGLRTDLVDYEDRMAVQHFSMLDAVGEVSTAIIGDCGYTLGDVVDRLGGPSVFSLEDVWSKLGDIQTAIECQD